MGAADHDLMIYLGQRFAIPPLQDRLSGPLVRGVGDHFEYHFFQITTCLLTLFCISGQTVDYMYVHQARGRK